MSFFNDESNSLSSDLEWMLESGQASNAMLVESLVTEYFTPLYRLALSFLDDPELAIYAAVETFIAAPLNKHLYRSHLGVKIWFFRLGLEVIQKIQKQSWSHRLLQKIKNLVRAKPKPNRPVPNDRTEKALWQAMDWMREKMRWILLFRLSYGWSVLEIAQLFQMEENAVIGQLDAAHRIARLVLLLPGGTEVQLTRKEMDLALQHTLDSRWPSEELPHDEVSAVMAEIEAQSQKRNVGQRQRFYLKEALLVGGVILLIAGSVYSVNRFVPERIPPTPSPIPTPTPRLLMEYIVQPGDSWDSIAGKLGVTAQELADQNHMETGVMLFPGQYLLYEPMLFDLKSTPTPVQQVERHPLEIDNTMGWDKIRQILAASSGKWNTLWVDALRIYYGPQGYVGPPYVIRSQAWISQPNRSLEISGFTSGEMMYYLLNIDGLTYQMSKGSDRVWLRQSDPGFLSSWLNDILFLGKSSWLNLDGWSSVRGNETVAYRKAVVVDWMSANPLAYPGAPRKLRLWIDLESGLILHMRQFGGENFQTVVMDILVTKISYDVNFRQQQLFDPHYIRKEGFVQDYRGQLIPPGEKITIPEMKDLYGHERRGLQAPPPDYDASYSQLFFQYPLTATVGLPLTVPPYSVELISDDYYLGNLKMGDPFQINCDRSPDGMKLAYYSGDPWQTRQNDGWASPFRWVSLADLQDVHMLENIEAFNFAFAPDSRRLAFFGNPLHSALTGVHILDIETGRYDDLLHMDSADSLVWSPDGKYLAFIGSLSSGYEPEAFVMNVETREIVYQVVLDYDSYINPEKRSPDWPFPDWPVHKWEVEFPKYNRGLESCARPGK